MKTVLYMVMLPKLRVYVGSGMKTVLYGHVTKVAGLCR